MHRAFASQKFNGRADFDSSSSHRMSLECDGGRVSLWLWLPIHNGAQAAAGVEMTRN